MKQRGDYRLRPESPTVTTTCCFALVRYSCGRKGADGDNEAREDNQSCASCH